MSSKKIIGLYIVVSLCLLISATSLCAVEDNHKKSDTWLKAQLITSYTLNEYINPFDIEVDVRDGIAYLRGRVDSGIERDLAVEIARGIDGIREVKAELDIVPDTNPQQEKTGFAGKVKDATLTAKVKYRLLLNKYTDSLDIDVDTDNGVVTLSGYVGSKEKKELALMLAGNTAGVGKVIDKLSVAADKVENSGNSLEIQVEKLSRNLKDVWITTKARSLLLISSEAEGARYEITTRNGHVTVSGQVRSKKQAEDIQRILQDLQGVREVENQLAVVDG